MYENWLKRTVCALVLGLCLASVGQAVLPSPIGWWKLDEDAGSIALDSSGNGNHGTLIADAAWATGKIGSCIDLDGIGDYVDCGNSTIFDRVDGFSLCVWIDWRSVGASIA